MDDPFLFSRCIDTCCCEFDHLSCFTTIRDEFNYGQLLEDGALLMSSDISTSSIDIIVPNEEAQEEAAEPSCDEEKEIIVLESSITQSAIVKEDVEHVISKSQVVHVNMDMDLDSLHSSSSTTTSYNDENTDDDDVETDSASLSSSSNRLESSPYRLRFGRSMKRLRLQERKLKALAIERLASYISSTKRRSPVSSAAGNKGTKDVKKVVRENEWSRYDLGLLSRLLRGYTKEDALPNVDFAYRVLVESSINPAITTVDSVENPTSSSFSSFNASREDLKIKFGQLRATVADAGKSMGGGGGLSLYTSILDLELNSMMNPAK